MAISKAKEDSHKKHPIVHYINKSVNAKINEFEMLHRPKADLLLQQSTSILKIKKKALAHQDTICKLKNQTFIPRSINKKIEMTTSKTTMETAAFKIIADRNKAKQDQHIQDKIKIDLFACMAQCFSHTQILCFSHNRMFYQCTFQAVKKHAMSKNNLQTHPSHYFSTVFILSDNARKSNCIARRLVSMKCHAYSH